MPRHGPSSAPPLSFLLRGIMAAILIAFFLPVLFVLGEASVSDHLKKNLTNLRTAKVVPDVIPDVPGEGVVVIYPQSEVLLGSDLKPKETRWEPNIFFDAKRSEMYTLIMLDPDAPSPRNPTLRHWVHWLVVNIKGSSTLRSGITLYTYEGAAPPKGSGKHRYVFLVYAQGKKSVKETAFRIVGKRGAFKLKQFLDAAGLKNLFAANFFYSERK